MNARDDRGSGSVLVLALAGVLVVTGSGGLALGSVLVASARAGSAADLAALAAARRAADPAGGGSAAGAPCDAARSVARASGAQLVGCTVQPGTPGGGASGPDEAVVSVVVRVPLPAALRRFPGATGRARAGARPVLAVLPTVPPPLPAPGRSVPAAPSSPAGAGR